MLPNQDTTGAHVNIAAAGVAAHAPNQENAIAFLEYLTTPGRRSSSPTRTTSSRSVAGVEVGEIAALYGDFKRDTLNLSVLGENQPKAQAIFNEIGFP